MPTTTINFNVSAVGASILGAADPSAVSWIRVNANNTVTYRSAADTRTDLGVGLVANGGTGLTAVGTALQLLRTNAAGTGLEYVTPTTSIIAEGSNQYFTEARVRATVLTGLSVSGSNITSTDSVLTALGKAQNQINSLVGGVNYQGTWNATTNSPALASGVGTKGYYYVVSVAGSTNLDGVTDWKLGDWAIFNGTTWEKVDNTDAVISVNGYVGAVTLVKADVGLGNVENTALSTWAGTSNITTVGTIGTGTWSATAIGVTKGGTGLTALGTSLQQLRVNAGGTALEYFTPAAAGSAISALTAAAGTNTINNANYVQEWQWNTLAGNSGLKLTSTSTAAASNLQKVFEISLSGANATSSQSTYGAYITNTHTGDGTNLNVAGYFSVSNGRTNYPPANQQAIITGEGGIRMMPYVGGGGAGSYPIYMGLGSGLGENSSGAAIFGANAIPVGSAGNVIGTSNDFGSWVMNRAGVVSLHTANMTLAGTVAETSNEKFRIHTDGSVYIGNGATSTAAASGTINGTAGSGSDNQGANLFYYSGRSTGNKTGGYHSWGTSDAGASASTLRAITEKARLVGGGDLVLGITSDTKGLVLKSPDGHYWRITVDNAGVLSTADTGTSIPT